MGSAIMQYFGYSHQLGSEAQVVSMQIGLVAQYMEEHVQDGPEKSAGLRKLLEAKDCFVRAKLSELPPRPPIPSDPPRERRG